MTPEQIKHREFPVRLKGYDPDEVRRFLDQVAAVFRATVADSDGRVPTDENDLSAILTAAHDAAEKIVTDANNKVAALIAKAEDKHRQATEDASRAKQILERAQERSSVINADCRDAQQALIDAENRAKAIVAEAHEDASKVLLTERDKEIEAQFEADARKRIDEVDAAAERKLGELDQYVARRQEEVDTAADAKMAELDQYVAQRHQEIDALHEAARVSLDEAQHTAVVAQAEAEEQAGSVIRLAEREARKRIEVLEQRAIEERSLSEHEARERVSQILAAAQGRIDALAVREQELQARVAEAQAELRSIVERFVGDDATIDLRAGDPVVAFEGTYDEGITADGSKGTDVVDGVDDKHRHDEEYDEYFDVELPEDPADEDTEAALTEVTLRWNKPAWALAGSGAPLSQ